MRPYIIGCDGSELHVGDYVQVSLGGRTRVLQISSLIYEEDSESATSAKVGGRYVVAGCMSAIDLGTFDGVVSWAIAECGGRPDGYKVDEAVRMILDITSGDGSQEG